MALDQQFLEDLLATNKSKGVAWTAGETSLLHLTPAERKLRLGYIPGPDETALDERERIATANLAAFRTRAAVAVAYPGAWDWRNVNGQSYISPIKDQGNCGSCVAFGSAATIDGTERTSTNLSLNNPNGYTLQDVSEAQLFYCGAEPAGYRCSTGWYVSGALAYATNPGVAPEACFPYSAGDQPCNLAPGWQGQVTKVGASGYLNTTDSMKTWLSTRGPLIACFKVYSDFFGYTGGVYHWNGSAPYEGGHCISVIGYSDSLQAWLCKNSWGTGWGMGGYFYIGYGQCGIDSGMWSVNSFSKLLSGPKTLWSTGNMGQGPGAVGWLIGDVNGDGKAEVVQPWADGGSLGMIVYHWNGSAMTTLWSSGNMGQGPGAVHWFIGDVNGDGKAEVVQAWANGGSLGMIVYGWNGSAMTTLWSTGDIGQGPGAVSWLIGDVNGDGKAEIVQQWANGGSLGTIVYHWNGSAMTTLWSTGNMGQGPGAVSWLIGDVNGDGKAEIVQQWANGGSLGTIVYHWNGSAMATLWSTGNMGQGPGAVSWLIGDVNGDGKAEVLQQWANGGSLGMIVYGWNGSAMTTLWSSNNMGQGPGAVSWLIGKVNGDGKAQIMQQWVNGGSLGMIIYDWQNGGMTTQWASNNMGQGPGAVSWLSGDVLGNGKDEILQQWANGGSLGMIVYGY
jgi:hypothetical protein